MLVVTPVGEAEYRLCQRCGDENARLTEVLQPSKLGLVRSLKEECLTQIIPLGERQLRRAMTENTEHYHLERNHQGIGTALIERATGAVGRAMNVEQEIACALVEAKDVQSATQ